MWVYACLRNCPLCGDNAGGSFGEVFFEKLLTKPRRRDIILSRYQNDIKNIDLAEDGVIMKNNDKAMVYEEKEVRAASGWAMFFITILLYIGAIVLIIYS